ncbi:protein DpdG [Streptomyces bobili]|uniref:protein DpdG n=1 Tax=Streptomyces bobili TaxID=67280 RepID=UPI002258230F|nr:protein DpdG [Streptomyces bobili]MCX5528921.1 protein DpdG [Streptomyces bobili]
MALLNTPVPYPGEIWVVVRFLASQSRPVPYDTLHTFLEPHSHDSKKLTTVHHSLSTLRSLGLAEESGDGQDWILAGDLADLRPDGYATFQRALRSAVLGLRGHQPAETADDLRRALVWSLTRDPFSESFNWAIVDSRHQKDAPDGELVFVNPTRWPPFTAWAASLGFGAPAPHIAQRYIPDCTRAVQQVLEEHVPAGAPADALDVLRLLREHLPVLPGGGISENLGYGLPDDRTVGTALSFALMRGEHEKWLVMSSDSDAKQPIKLQDPERLSIRLCSSITRQEATNV